jgi:hypothetical protein
MDVGGVRGFNQMHYSWSTMYTRFVGPNPPTTWFGWTIWVVSILFFLVSYNVHLTFVCMCIGLNLLVVSLEFESLVHSLSYEVGGYGVCMFMITPKIWFWVSKVKWAIQHFPLVLFLLNQDMTNRWLGVRVLKHLEVVGMVGFLHFCVGKAFVLASLDSIDIYDR